ncbi:hypothetical protein TRFO_15821 [Tritrichomonas foetus]|uniref:Uncharacterized protein n=1 Tax=Tritrichomonas foetus TaxID=1144522 RepID=A0A1J4KWL5_9EUKA|nr:hypothetical protein TRFO_15821 [Tritrichomonas foetus]|eukprot:OHT13925.1 hypothetical protein TRFO_15821 [Tritrichomonas foetus]
MARLTLNIFTNNFHLYDENFHSNFLHMSTNAFLSDPTFPQDIDLQRMLPFIVPIPNMNNLIPSATNKYAQNFKLVKEALISHQDQLDSFILETTNLDKFNKIKMRYQHFIHPEKNEAFRRSKILNKFQKSYTEKVVKVREAVQNDVIKLLSDFIMVCEWFLQNPQPYFLDVSRAFPNENIITFSRDRELIKQYNAINYAAKEQFDYMMMFPELFSVDEQNRLFLKNSIDLALSQRKADTLYFEPLQCEENLFLFFQSSKSPILHLIQENSFGNDSADVLNWIKNAANILLEYENKPLNQSKSPKSMKTSHSSNSLNTSNSPSNQNTHQNSLSSTNLSNLNDSIDDIEDRRIIISIFLARFVFDLNYPKFSYIPNSLNKEKYNEKIEKMSKMSPKEIHVELKYIPEHLIDQPCTELFKHSSIASAPIEWLRSAEYKTCPLDAAFCISKVHESLSIMATLQAATNSQKEKESRSKENQNEEDIKTTSKDFFSKIPGFDDIFAIWLCLLCAAKLADAKGLSDFVSEWSRLPGFSHRFCACITYLEAAISQIECYGEENDETDF